MWEIVLESPFVYRVCASDDARSVYHKAMVME